MGLLNTWNFLSAKSVFVIHGRPLGPCLNYANEVTHDGPLDSFWMRAGHARMTNHVIRRLEL